MMNAILKGLATAVTGIVATVSGTPVLAAMNQASVDTSIKAAVTADVPSASDLAKIESQEDKDQAQINTLASTTPSVMCNQACVDQKLKQMGDTMTTNRINALNAEKAAVAQAPNMSDADRAALIAKLDASINDMNTLKAKIDNASNDHATLLAAVESITVDYRVYLLVIPQVSIMASADHKEYVYTQLSATATDLQTKINGMNDAAKKGEAQAKLNDMKAKLADAKSNADAAYAEIVNLVPDQGDGAKRKANNDKLNEALTKVHAAHADFDAARADVAAINALLGNDATDGNGHTIMKVTPTPAHPVVTHPINATGNGSVIMKVTPGSPAVSVHADGSVN